MTVGAGGTTLAPVAAVVPVHHPGPEVVARVRALAAQVGGRVVVVDDTGERADPAHGAVLAEVSALADRGVALVRHAENEGIAAALVTGVSTARRRWPDTVSVLTVDQDSDLDPHHVDRLLAAAAAAAAAGWRPGLVGPAQVEGLPSRVARRGRTDAVALGREPVQSGLLVPLSVWDEVGGVDPGLVIDGVDSDLWLKVLDSGRHVVVAPGLAVRHRLGRAHPVRLAGRTLDLPVSAPFRSYYLVRNRLRLAARHGRRHPGWALAQVLGLVRHLLVVLVVDPPGRRERLRAVTAGVRDAVADRGGPRPGSRPARPGRSGRPTGGHGRLLP